MGKTYAGTYLYNKYSEYEQQIFNFIMSGTEIDKNSSGFEDIIFDVKRRQITNALVKILLSDKVVLMINPGNPLSRAFKVIMAKDLKGNKGDKKIFIDCTDFLAKNQSGKYALIGNGIDMLVAHLVTAMHTYIYYVDKKRLLNNSKLIRSSTACFSSLFTNIVDYVSKISTMDNARAKCVYLSSLYFISNILERDYKTNTNVTIATKLAGISKREADIIDMKINPNSFLNIKFFIETLADSLKISKLTLDVIVEKWMTIYGTGTVFGLELFPAFAAMITDAYSGSYLNNQKTIEKITGKDMIEFTKTILQIGSDSV